MSIFVCSDWHFNHDKPFIYEPRGFTNIKEMNEAIIFNHNEIVTNDDDVFVLGDLMLGDNTAGAACVNQLNGKLHVVCGNHDTLARRNFYSYISNIVEIKDAIFFKYRKYNFYCSHYPSFTGNLQKESLHQMVLNLFGHTHSKDKFFQDMPFMYNVAMEAHNCTPVNLDDIIIEMKEKMYENNPVL